MAKNRKERKQKAVNKNNPKFNTEVAKDIEVKEEKADRAENDTFKDCK